MPQFAWANDPKAIEEVMTFVLGLTGEKIAGKYLPKSTTRRKTPWPQGAKLLNRYNCTGCHVLEMPKYTVAAGTKLAEAFTDFKTNLRSPTPAGSTDYLKEFYPDLTFDPKTKLDAERSRPSSGSRPTTASRSRSRGCRSACSRTS